MKKQVLIIGGNGHGSVIAACIKDNQKNGYDEDIEICGFVNDFVCLLYTSDAADD